MSFRNKVKNSKKSKKFKVGDKIPVGKSHEGIIRYAGQVHFDSGYWYGVELLGDAIGEHNGKIGSQRYFKTENKKAIFIEESKIKTKTRAKKKKSKNKLPRSPKQPEKKVTPPKVPDSNAFSLGSLRKCGRFVDPNPSEVAHSGPISIAALKRKSSTFSKNSMLTYAETYSSMSTEELQEEFVDSATAGNSEELLNMLSVVKENNIPFDINFIDEDGHNLLYWAAESGDVDCVRLLIENGADINAQDEEGDAPLIMASRYGSLDCVELLLENGADLNLKDNDGNTALMWAQRNGHAKCSDLLTATMNKSN